MSLRYSYIITFFLSLISFFILYLLNIDHFISFIIVFFIILAVMMLPLLKVTLFETNMEKVEKFLLNNKNNANFYIIYALANNLDDDVKELTNILVQKSKNKSRQALYKVIEALYFEDYATVKTIVEDIEAPMYRNYYQAIIAMEEGDFNRTDELIAKISNKWMHFALLAERERKQNNLEKGKDYAQKAKEATKGLQRYLLHKTFEKEFNL